MKRKKAALFGALTISIVACSSVAERTMGDVLSDAGQMIADAGVVLTDAGQMLTDAGEDASDSGTAHAQPVEVQCNLEELSTRMEMPGTTSETYFLLAELRDPRIRKGSKVSVVLCDLDRPPQACPSGWTCAGSEFSRQGYAYGSCISRETYTTDGVARAICGSRSVNNGSTTRQSYRTARFLIEE